MNLKEEQILEYLDKLQLQITDPTQKQQDYYESKKHKILNLEHKLYESDPSSPFSLREVFSPISPFHTYSVQSCDINNNNRHHHHHHHHNHNHNQIHHTHNSFRLHLNIHSLIDKKVEI